MFTILHILETSSASLVLLRVQPPPFHPLSARYIRLVCDPRSVLVLPAMWVDLVCCRLFGVCVCFLCWQFTYHHQVFTPINTTPGPENDLCANAYVYMYMYLCSLLGDGCRRIKIRRNKNVYTIPMMRNTAQALIYTYKNGNRIGGNFM